MTHPKQKNARRLSSRGRFRRRPNTPSQRGVGNDLISSRQRAQLPGAWVLRSSRMIFESSSILSMSCRKSRLRVARLCRVTIDWRMRHPLQRDGRPMRPIRPMPPRRAGGCARVLVELSLALTSTLVYVPVRHGRCCNAATIRAVMAAKLCNEADRRATTIVTVGRADADSDIASQEDWSSDPSKELFLWCVAGYSSQPVLDEMRCYFHCV